MLEFVSFKRLYIITTIIKFIKNTKYYIKPIRSWRIYPTLKKLDVLTRIRRARREKKKRLKLKKWLPFIENSVFHEVFKRASAIEPNIGHTDDLVIFVLPPTHIHEPADMVRKRIPQTEYDVIICIPFGRLGGADKVAGLLSRSLQQVLPSAKMLILQTDQPRIDKPDWYAKNVDIVDISDILGKEEQPRKEMVLYSTLLGLRPRFVFNVNSRLCWNVFKRFGKRLSLSMDLFAYMFCYDISPKGCKTGYPAEYFHCTIDYVKALLVDSMYLKNELSKTYELSVDISDKIAVISTPTDNCACSPIMAENQVTGREKRSRPVVLWAGRFDRQKRFDIVIEVARLMSHVDFICWGEAVLDAPPQLSSLPGNMKINGRFEQITDLPLQDSDLWLYTSSWDGIPTILLEIGVLGMPIVASAVGGVPEVIGEERGWLVHDFNNSHAYVKQINDALNYPEERIARAKKLQSYVSTQHAMDTYNNKLVSFVSV